MYNIFLTTELNDKLLEKQHELAKVEADLEKLQPFKVRKMFLMHTYIHNFTHNFKSLFKVVWHPDTAQYSAMKGTKPDRTD